MQVVLELGSPVLSVGRTSSPPARPSSPPDPCRGLLTLSPAHCVACRSRCWALMPADTDTMAPRMGCEGMEAGVAAQLHAGLAPESQGAQAVAITMASGAHVWACIKTRVIKTEMGRRERLRYSRLRGTGGHGEPAPGIAPTKHCKASPHPQTREPFLPAEFPLLVKMFGSLENLPNNPCLC